MGNNTSKKIAKYFFIYFSVVAFGMVTYAVKIDLTRSKEKVFLLTCSRSFLGPSLWINKYDQSSYLG
jgi:hypothetical protein